MSVPIPETISTLKVRDPRDVSAIPQGMSIVFSAVEFKDKQTTREFEFSLAKNGYAVVSTNSANRQTGDVPMIIPEINSDHTEIIPIQQKRRGFPPGGFVVVKPNCSIQSYIIVLEAMNLAGYPVNKVQVTTLQALSGAGYQALVDPTLQKNVVPFIQGEEEKTELEPLKIFGKIAEGGIIPADHLQISALCTRVPVIDGHTAVVHLGFKHKKPTVEEFKSILSQFTAEPQKMKLPSAPDKPIVLMNEENRPQPVLDKNTDKGMTVSVGRIDRDTFFDIRFVGLSHNTVRGAAGGAILTAELLVHKGFIKS